MCLLLIIWSSFLAGIHCWVADERARKLSDEARKAIVHYLSVVDASDNKASLGIRVIVYERERGKEVFLICAALWE